MKSGYLFTTILFLSFLNFISSAKVKPDENSTIHAKHLTAPIKLTGKLDDPAWLQAEPVELKYEINPGDNSPAVQKTIVRVLYDDNNIYFGFQCFDTNPKEIRANITDRDKIFQDDFVLVGIDTYGNFERSYELVVNPFGIQGDLLATSGGEDASMDYIWRAAASINDTGWTAEMAVPFSSLSFPNSKEQNWRINLVRTLPRSSRTQDSWMRIDRNVPGFMTQAGYLEGLENIHPGGSIEILPYAIGQKMGSLNDYEDPNSGFKFNPIEGRVGGGIKYSPSPNFALDAVINPDFSQIESDADQISVNTTFALDYEEKRPFFLLGRELLQTPMYYSRSINDPLAAGRITGKSGAFTYLYMTAYDRNTIIDVPGEERSNTVSSSLKSFVNIGRLRYDLGDESYLGGMILTRNLSGGSNYVAGFDWKYKFLGNWYFLGEGFLSRTNELNDTTLLDTDRKFGSSGYTAKFDGEKYSGSGIHLELNHSEKSYNFNLVLNNFSPTYQTYNGLFSLVGYRQIAMGHEFVFYPENSFMDRGEIGFSSYLQFNFDNIKKEQVLQPYVSATLKGQTNINVSYLLVNDERFAGVYFKNINRASVYISTQPMNEISLYANASFGKFIYRSDEPKMGKGHNLYAGFTLKPTSQLSLDFSYTRAGLSDADTDTLFFDGNIFRLVGIYQFSPELFFRTILQYNSFDKSFQLYPLFSYKLNAFTTFFAGATSGYLNYSNPEGIVNTDQQYFLKVQYLLGI